MATQVTLGGTYTPNYKTDPETTAGSAIKLPEQTAQEVVNNNIISEISTIFCTSKKIISSIGNFIKNYWQLLLIGVVALILLRGRK